MTGLPLTRWATDALFSNAERAAQTLLKQYQRGNPGPWVGDEEWTALRASVALHPAYLFKGPAGKGRDKKYCRDDLSFGIWSPNSSDSWAPA